MFTCELCLFRCERRLQLIQHMFLSHSYEPNFKFKCGIANCLYSFKFGSSYSSWKSHVTRKHPTWKEEVQNCTNEPTETSINVPVISSTTEEETSDNSLHPSLPFIIDDHTALQEEPIRDMEDNGIMEDTSASPSRTAALFLLTFKEKYNLPQSSINFAVGAINDLINSVCTSLQSSLQVVQPPSDIIVSQFKYDDPFASLTTEYQQNKFYREEFGLVEPVTVTLGSTYKYKKRGAKRQPVESIDTCQYVPLLENLEWLLQNKDFYNEVYKSRFCSDNMTDYCDGQVFKDHPLFNTVPNALQLIAYYDEVEVSNPLGSYRTKHKLALFYFMIGNIEPRLRSALRCIQLIACVKSTDLVQYGFRKVLQPFIDDVNKLYKGVTMTIHGKQQTVKGTVLFFLADTIGAHEIGGFKLGLSRSFRKCRHCLASQQTMSKKFKGHEFTPRSQESYDYHCSLLQGPLRNEDSTTYGVTDRSILNDVDSFDIIKQLPQDIMHVLLEGVVPHELQLMLYHYIINQKLFTLDLLNERIMSFCYSSDESHDKPTVMSYQALTKESSIRQSSAQVWILARNLPLMIGDRISENDDFWECYLLLLDILQVCTAQILSHGLAGYLEALISDHHHLFVRCYTEDNFIPKMHYMVHLPQQIIRTGPLINTWCMRMEAKNKYFKDVAHSSNFKNVCFTISKRHQKLLCSYVMSSSFFDKGIEYGPAKDVTFTEEELQLVKNLPDFNTTAVQKTRWVKCNGTKYQAQDYLLIGWQDDDLPIFGRIKTIYHIDNAIYFKISKFPTLGIDRHFHSIVIGEKMLVEEVQCIDSLVTTQVFNAHLLRNDSLYITLRSHVERLY